MRTPASVRMKEDRKFRKVMLRRRKMFLLKKLFKEFWDEWGLTMEDVHGLLVGFLLMFVIPGLLLILGSLI